MAPVVLLASPATVPVTFTVSVQEELCARLLPDRLMAPVPAVAVTVPPQVLLTPGVAATTNVALPAPLLTGSVSLKATPVRSPPAVVFGLLMVKVTVVVPFSGMLPAPNALLMVGGATTVMLAVAVLPVPAVVSVALTLLLFTPAVVPCTFTETVHDAPGARLAPESDTEDDPSVAVAVPLQVVLRFPGVATTRPAGSESVNEIPLRVRFWLVLLTVMVRLVVPFRGMVVAPKALALVGGLMTVRLAVGVLPSPASLDRIWTLLL